jgi:demethylmenaquinone methyltransferase / 2-methoxy-6-polyprenyl-1,4-benzoquinol methylase
VAQILRPTKERPVPTRGETRALFDGAARGYDTLAQLLSGGQYLKWRDRLVTAATRHGVGNGSRVLDIATGTGLIATPLATEGAEVTGLDLSRGMLKAARGRAPHRTRLVQGDARRLPFPDHAFDATTMSYLLRYVEDPAAVLLELVRTVRPGGFFGFIEFHVPQDAFWRSLWRLHTRLVLPTGGLLGGPAWWRVGRFLGPSIETFWDRHDLAAVRTMMSDAGLGEIHIETPSLGGGLVALGTRTGTRAARRDGGPGGRSSIRRTR